MEQCLTQHLKTKKVRHYCKWTKAWLFTYTDRLDKVNLYQTKKRIMENSGEQHLRLNNLLTGKALVTMFTMQFNISHLADRTNMWNKVSPNNHIWPTLKVLCGNNNNKNPIISWTLHGETRLVALSCWRTGMLKKYIYIFLFLSTFKDSPSATSAQWKPCSCKMPS